MLDFLREARLDRVGCFAYSPVEGAQANELEGQLPEEVRNERRDRLMALQAEISAEKLREKIGKTQEVLIDEFDEEAGLAIGRTKADAPDIDGKVYIETMKTYKPGDFVKVTITQSEEEYDLVGVPADEPELLAQKQREAQENN